MTYRFQFRRYRVPFRVPVRNAHGWWAEREGLIVRLEDENGATGFGEAAPVPGFGDETVGQDEAAARALGEQIGGEALAAVPARLACLRHAIAVALAEIGRDTPHAPVGPRYLPVAALLPAGRAALALIESKAESGFRTFKWKVGIGELADELALLDDVCAALPPGAKLRLDANGAWERRQAERWLERCAERPVEFVEQPCFAGPSPGAARQRRSDDVLLGLAGDYPTPVALDESIAGDGDLERWLGAGWPGVFVVKPSLHADLPRALAALARAKAHVVFSSALETAVGARTALRAAFAWAAETDAGGAAPPRALGFGVWPLFADARFDGPAAAPFIRVEDVERIDPEAIWTALS